MNLVLVSKYTIVKGRSKYQFMFNSYQFLYHHGHTFADWNKIFSSLLTRFCFETKTDNWAWSSSLCPWCNNQYLDFNIGLSSIVHCSKILVSFPIPLDSIITFFIGYWLTYKKKDNVIKFNILILFVFIPFLNQKSRCW